MWWAVGGVGIILLAVAWYFLLRVRSMPVFYAAYNLELEKSGSKERALRAAIAIFQQRPPFSALSASEVDHLVRNFVSLPDPRVLAFAFKEIDKHGDASPLRDPQNVENLVASIRSRQLKEQGSRRAS